MKMTPEIKRVLTNFQRDYDAAVTLHDFPGNRTVVVVGEGESELSSFVWERSREPDSQQDRWRYLDPATNNTYSHPALSGAVALVLKGFVANGDFQSVGPNDRLDERDKILREEAEIKRELRERPSVPMQGDVLRYPDGELCRATHVWTDCGEHDGVQTNDGLDCGSFCLEPRTGSMGYSGGLNPAIPMDRIKPTDERTEASCWFFHHGHAKAHNGVPAGVSVRIWEVLD